VIALQFTLPERFVVHPAYVTPTVEAVLLVVLTVMHPDRLSQRTQELRIASQVLLAIIALTNAASVVLLVRTITSGHGIAAVTLLVGGARSG